MCFHHQIHYLLKKGFSTHQVLSKLIEYNNRDHPLQNWRVVWPKWVCKAGTPVVSVPQPCCPLFDMVLFIPREQRIEF